MQKKTSLKDIAAKVGVSTALVSYVLNNKKEGRIRKEVAQKIKDIAAKLNYRPNQIARSLKTNQTNTIGLIVADISNPFSSGLARVIEDEANNHGYTVIFGSSDEKASKSAKLIDALLNRQVDGLIISPPAGSELQILNLKKQKVPFVLLDRYFPDIPTNNVSLNNYAAAYEAVQHFIEIGRKKIALINYNTTLFNLNERETGYKAAMKQASIEVDPKWMQRVDISNDQAEIEAAVAILLEEPGKTDAILFGSNRIAAGALKYINSLNLRVPEDLCLIGFDETEIFDFFHAPLTYVQQPVAGLGQLATQLLLENIKTKQRPKQILMNARLVTRRSTMQ
ncbi:MAG: LacI family transcriptional regulator [Sphingobacteriales bacterium]|nr:MAG: LacI family transcriptional regulator [Sphingobacteriales bacterium]